MKWLLYFATGLSVAIASRKRWWGFWDWLLVATLWWLYLAIVVGVLLLLAADRAFDAVKSALSGYRDRASDWGGADDDYSKE